MSGRAVRPCPRPRLRRRHRASTARCTRPAPPPGPVAARPPPPPPAPPPGPGRGRRAPLLRRPPLRPRTAFLPDPRMMTASRREKRDFLSHRRWSRVEAYGFAASRRPDASCAALELAYGHEPTKWQEPTRARTWRASARTSLLRPAAPQEHPEQHHEADHEGHRERDHRRVRDAGVGGEGRLEQDGHRDRGPDELADDDQPDGCLPPQPADLVDRPRQVRR